MLEEENEKLKNNNLILSEWMLLALAYENLYYSETLSEVVNKEEAILREKWNIITNELLNLTHGEWLAQYYQHLKDKILIEVLNHNRGVITKYL